MGSSKPMGKGTSMNEPKKSWINRTVPRLRKMAASGRRQNHHRLTHRINPALRRKPTSSDTRM
jgi:hypothetical protein